MMMIYNTCDQHELFAADEGEEERAGNESMCTKYLKEISRFEITDRDCQRETRRVVLL